MAKKTKLKLGFPGHFKEVAVSLPAGDPLPWDFDADLKVVSQRVPRVDGPDKVSGRARYTFDLRLPGMLHAAVLRCPHPHARLRRIDTSKARANPEVRAVLVMEEKEYRFAGAEVAAVAATTLSAARQALSLIEVQYETLPFVTDPDIARRPGSPKVRTAGNVEVSLESKRGSVETAFRESDAVVELTFRTPVALHTCLEGHGRDRKSTRLNSSHLGISYAVFC